MRLLGSIDAFKRHMALSYGAAALLVAVATAIVYWMQVSWGLSAPAVVFLAAVTASTWLGGMRPGLLATALALGCFYYFILPLDGPVAATTRIQVVPEILFAAVACYVIWLTTAERGAAKALRNAHAELQRNNQALQAENARRKQTEEELRESADRLQHLSHRLLAVQEEERHHLSRELHDEFGQLLGAVMLYLQAAKIADGESAGSSLEQGISLLQQAGVQVRRLALELRPRMLETEGLEATLRWLAEQHEERTGMDTQLTCHVDRVSGDRAIACFRVAQEALTNVVRHAQARHVWIDLRSTDEFLQLEVRDDGVGFDVASTVKRAAGAGNLGIVGMKERIEILGGTLQIKSQPRQGTAIRVSLPMPAPTRPAPDPPAQDTASRRA